MYYTGVTNSIDRRIQEHQDHREGKIPGFTQKYNCHKLLYFEEFSDINQAIEREKIIKKLSRVNKNRLIDSMNPDRRDLYYEIHSI